MLYKPIPGELLAVRLWDGVRFGDDSSDIYSGCYDTLGFAANIREFDGNPDFALGTNYYRFCDGLLSHSFAEQNKDFISE